LNYRDNNESEKLVSAMLFVNIQAAFGMLDNFLEESLSLG
jgi:hypothetical protein